MTKYKQPRNIKPVKLVPTKSRYPGLKQIIKSKGLTFKSLYLQYDRMRPEQFAHIISGSINEPDGFLETLLSALENIGVTTTEDELKQNIPL